jgi:hypothetical protein
MTLVGVTLSMMIGRNVPIPAPATLMNALQSVEVTHSDEGRSGFQIEFLAARSGGFSLDYDLLSNPLLLPFSRVVLILTLGGTPRVLMDGIITHHQLVSGEGPAGSTFAVTGEDVSVMMDLQQKSIEHPAQSSELSVLAILASYELYGLRPVVIPSPFVDVPLPVERVPLQQQTDLEYIRSLASDVGYVFYVRPGPVPLTNTAYWGPPTRVGFPQPALNVNLGAATNVKNMQFAYNALAPTLVRSAYQGIEFGEELPADSLTSTRLPPLAALPALLANFPNVRTTQLTTAGLDEIQALAQAQGMTDRSVDAVVEASGEVDPLRYGDILSARDLVGVRGAGWEYDGLYYVKQVSHRLNRRGYAQSFTLTREGVGATVPVVRP